MFFPVGDDQVVGGHKPLFSYSFLVVNILVFLYQLTLSKENCGVFMYHFGSIPAEIVAGQDYFTLFTSMFLHAGFLHIIGNMLFLWVFADNIEATIGNVNFIIFYLLGGLAASLVHIYLNPTSTIPTVGASGAIAAVLGAYMVLFPKNNIKIRFLVFKPFSMIAILFLGIWFVQNLYSGIGSLGIESAQSGGTAWWAHIGGFVFGILIGFLAKYTYMKNVSDYA